MEPRDLSGVAFLTKSLLGSFSGEIFANRLPCLNHPSGISLAFLIDVRAHGSCPHSLKQGWVFFLGSLTVPSIVP